MDHLSSDTRSASVQWRSAGGGRWELVVQGDTLDVVLARTAVEFAARSVELRGAGEVDRLPSLALVSDPSSALKFLLGEVIELAESESFVVRGINKLVFGSGELRVVLVGLTGRSRVRGEVVQEPVVEAGGPGWISRLVTQCRGDAPSDER
jgi:hypothetical protein